MMFWIYTIVICITLLPLLFIIWLFKEASPKYYGYLLSGGFLIFCSACAFWQLTEIRGSFFTEYPATKVLSAAAQKDYKQVVASMELWIYLFPSVLAAAGVNLITDFIKIKKPDNISGFKIT